jgi:chromosome segregation ATPase
MATNSSSLSSILMESMVALEKHVGTVEQKITTIFNSINGIMQYSSKTGETMITMSTDLKELKENIIYREDLISQLAVIHNEISDIIRVLENNNNEITNAISLLTEKIETIDQEILELKSQETQKNKGRFRK